MASGEGSGFTGLDQAALRPRRISCIKSAQAASRRPSRRKTSPVRGNRNAFLSVPEPSIMRPLVTDIGGTSSCKGSIGGKRRSSGKLFSNRPSLPQPTASGSSASGISSGTTLPAKAISEDAWARIVFPASRIPFSAQNRRYGRVGRSDRFAPDRARFPACPYY